MKEEADSEDFYIQKGMFEMLRTLGYHLLPGKINLPNGTLLWKTEAHPIQSECLAHLGSSYYDQVATHNGCPLIISEAIFFV